MVRLCPALLLLLLCATACTPRQPADLDTPAPTPAVVQSHTAQPQASVPTAPSPEPSAAVAIEPGTEDYFLLVDDKVFSVAEAGNAPLPFGELISSEEEFWPEIYAGTYWLTERYDGVILYFSTGPEGLQGGGSKLLHGIDVAPSAGEDTGPDIRTSRGVRLGDSLAAVLSAYPELEGKEEPGSDGTASLRLTDADEIYYLVFFMKDNQVVEIAAGANIQ